MLLNKRFLRFALPVIALAVMAFFPATGAQAQTGLEAEPGTLSGTVTSSAYSRPVAGADVELWHQSGGVWVELTTLATSSSGAWSYTTLETEPLHVRIVDPTGMHTPAWIGGTSVDTATDLTPVTSGVVDHATTLQLGSPAVIEGELLDDMTDLAVAGCKVELYGADGVYLDSRLTDSLGVYTFGNVPPGVYNLHFVDPAGDYLPQWWDWEDSQSTALDLDITVADTYYADGWLEAADIAAGFYFGPVAPAAGSVANPFVGQSTTLAVTLYDAVGKPQPSQRVVMQRLSGSYWGQVSTVVQDVAGTYSAAVAPDVAAPTRYRFRVFDRELGEYVYSPEFTITPHSGATAWSPPAMGGAGASGAITPGSVAEVRAALVDYAGAGIDGALPILQSSTDGVNFVNAPVAVENLGGGTYRCLVSPRTRTYYRFVFAGKGYNQASISAPTLLAIRQTLSVPSVPKKLRAGKAFYLKGVLRPKHLTEPESLGTARVYKRVGKKWVYKKKVSLSLTPRDSASCNYKARFKLPKGSYKAEVRFPTDLQHVAAVPVTKRFTVK